MNKKYPINVLWIEDNLKYKESFCLHLPKFGIEIEHFTNWSDAKKYLDMYLDEIHAVVLDAHCKLDDSESDANADFLHYAVVEMLLLFAKHHTIRPWYILSAGTMDYFNKTTNIISYYRKDFEEEWGEMVFKKKGLTTEDEDGESADIFANEDAIFESGEKQLIDRLINTVNIPNNSMSRHHDALRYVGSKSFFRGSARRNLLWLLDALYNPQEKIGFKFEGNPIRKIFESIVIAAVEYNIICPDVINNKNVQASEARRFFVGENPERLEYRYGAPSDYILNNQEASMLKTILHCTNIASHEDAGIYEEADLTLTEDNRDEYAACALMMCRIIKAMGKYLESHKDKDTNKSQWRLNPKSVNKENFTGKLCVSGNEYFVDDCKVRYSYDYKEGDLLELSNIVPNKDYPDSSPFMFFANKVKKISNK